MKNFARFLKNEEGAAAVEYGLLLALISLVAAVAMTPLGTAIAGIFSTATDDLTGAGAGAGAR